MFARAYNISRSPLPQLFIQNVELAEHSFFRTSINVDGLIICPPHFPHSNPLFFFFLIRMHQNFYLTRLWWPDHSCILIAVIVIMGNLFYWSMLEILFDIPVKHASKLEEVILGISYEDMHRTACASLHYMIRNLY
jgi:hypothetical protein